MVAGWPDRVRSLDLPAGRGLDPTLHEARVIVPLPLSHPARDGVSVLAGLHLQVDATSPWATEPAATPRGVEPDRTG